MSLRWLDNLKELFTQDKRDADLDRELRSHLDAETDEQVAGGLSPEDARDAARRALGNLPIIQENTRATWTLGRTAGAVRNVVSGIRQDVRYGLRGFRNQPAFTVAAVLALALGIGATTTIFSVIQNVLLDPYPMYSHVDRIVGLRVHNDASARPGGRQYFDVAEFLEYQAQAASFEDVIAGANEDTLYTGREGTEQFVGGLASGNTFSFMGVSAIIGRTISPDDAKPGAPPVFVMSYKLWVSRFGQDERLIGRSFILNGVPTTLIGVMPPRVSKLGADLWRPIRLDRADPQQSTRFYRFQARLKPGVTIADAQAEMNVIARRLAKVYPQLYPRKFTLQVEGLIDSIVGPFRTTLYTMAAGVGLLLLIACANVANMLLSRAAGREREMALRASLGAGRTRLVRQLLVESILLAMLGMAIGCAFSAVGITLLVSAIPDGLIPRESLIRLDKTALIFSLVIAAVTALIFGLAPALQTVKRDLLNPLRGSGKGTAAGFRGSKVSSGLVIAEIALSLVLLNSAGLLMRSFLKLQATELGFNPENLLFVRIPAGPLRETVASQQQFLEQVLSRLRVAPGVVSAAATTGRPPFGGVPREFDIVGLDHQDRWRADVELCSESYFRTLGMRLLQGRDFTTEDSNAGRKVAVVNQALVERHLKGVVPIGRTITLKVTDGQGQLEPDAFEIVGVVSDAKNDGIAEPSAPEIFLPSSARATPSRALIVKTAGPPAMMIESVKREIWSVDRSAAISDGETFSTILKLTAYAEPRLGLFVFGTFAAIGMVLVMLGVYSLIAYTVARQMREIGIRMAVGAGRSDVLRLTVGLGVRWMALGVIAGLLTSVAVTRVLASQLFDVSPIDPLTLVSAVAVVAIAAISATYFPALRATRVDPMVVLRYE